MRLCGPPPGSAGLPLRSQRRLSPLRAVPGRRPAMHRPVVAVIVNPPSNPALKPAAIRLAGLAVTPAASATARARARVQVRVQARVQARARAQARHQARAETPVRPRLARPVNRAKPARAAEAAIAGADDAVAAKAAMDGKRARLARRVPRAMPRRRRPLRPAPSSVLPKSCPAPTTKWARSRCPVRKPMTAMPVSRLVKPARRATTPPRPQPSLACRRAAPRTAPASACWRPSPTRPSCTRCWPRPASARAAISSR